MSVFEPAMGLAWIYSTLSGDSAMGSLAPGGFHRGLAPDGAATPYVIFAHQAGTDTLTMNAFRVISSHVYQIKAVGPASDTAALVAAASQIDVLFGGPGRGTTDGGLILSFYRESSFAIDELVAPGQKWSNFGGLYRLSIDQE